MKKETEKRDISFSTKELNTWVIAGLIDEALLVPKKMKELYDFIENNQDKLFNYFKEDFGDKSLQVSIPSTIEGLESANTLTVVNKKTGKKAYTLDKIMYFELIYGVNLKIKACEINDWEKVKNKLKKLTKDQSSLFFQTFSEMATITKGCFAQKDLIKIINKVLSKKTKSTKIRHSGHFADSKLQCSTNDKPLPETQRLIEELGGTIKAFGIKLTPPEDKLMNAIYKLLHDKSENKNITSDLFYAGNEEAKLVVYGDKQEKAPVLRIKPSELYKEYLGKDDYSGKEIIIIKNLLYSINDKKFLIRYDRKRKVHEEILTDRIEAVHSLLNIVSYIEGLTEKEVKKLDSGDASVREKKGELILALHPILTDQIKTKYVEYPEDINQRTIIASGGPLRVTKSITTLRDYMLREISANRLNPELNEETLIKQIGLSPQMTAGRKKRVSQRLDTAIQASKRMGLILEYKKIIGAQGQMKYVFTLNKDF